MSPAATEFRPSSSKAGAGAGENKSDWRQCLRGGFYSSDMGWWVPFHVGKLKSFNPRTGFGFLECTSTYSIFQADVYIHKSEVPVPWNVGQTVEFAVQQNNRGQPQAYNVLWIPLALAPKDSPSSGSAVAPEVSAAPSKERFLGILKSYAPSRGYGFVTSEEIVRRHKCDVYLDRSQMPPSGGHRIGQICEFAVSHNTKGQPQARAVDWDPVPVLPAATPVQDSASSGMPVGQKGPDQRSLQNLGKILSLVATGDKKAAVELAFELRESQDSVDYLSFTLQRLGEASTENAAGLTRPLAATLLAGLASELKDHPRLPHQQATLALDWCEAIITILGEQQQVEGGEGSELQVESGVPGPARDDLVAAAQAATSGDKLLFAGVLAQLGEETTSA